MYRSWTKSTTPPPQKAIPYKWYSSTVEQLSLPGVEEHLKKHPRHPHQMSRAQYEADPQTLWRAEGSDTLGGSSTSLTSSGLHFGERSAAEQRGKHLATTTSSSSRIEERPMRMFSLRTKGRFSNEPTADHPAAEVLPQTKGVGPDEDVGRGLWPQRRTGRWYLNEHEGDDGVLSGYTPQRKGFLTTHKEEVLKAHDAGKDVHPTILQQAQIGPEYSETIEPTLPHRPGKRIGRPKLFKALNEFSGSAKYVTNEEYAEGMRKMKEGSSEPIWGHIGESRPAGSPR